MLCCYVHDAAMCTTWMTSSRCAQITRSTSAGVGIGASPCLDIKGDKSKGMAKPNTQFGIVIPHVYCA